MRGWRQLRGVRFPPAFVCLSVCFNGPEADPEQSLILSSGECIVLQTVYKTDRTTCCMAVDWWTDYKQSSSYKKHHRPNSIFLQTRRRNGLNGWHGIEPSRQFEGTFCSLITVWHCDFDLWPSAFWRVSWAICVPILGLFKTPCCCRVTDRSGTDGQTDRAQRHRLDGGFVNDVNVDRGTHRSRRLLTKASDVIGFRGDSTFVDVLTHGLKARKPGINTSVWGDRPRLSWGRIVFGVCLSK